MFTQNMIDLQYQCHTVGTNYSSADSTFNVKDISGNLVPISTAYKGVWSASWHIFNSLTIARTDWLSNQGGQIASVYKLLTDTTAYIGRTTMTAFLHSGVILGTSNQAPTKDDYCLKGDWIVNFTATTNIEKRLTNYGAEILGVYGITNTDTNNITIGEIGLVMQSNSSTKVLLDRTTLSSPLIIEPNQTKTLLYSIRFGENNIPNGNIGG